MFRQVWRINVYSNQIIAVSLALVSPLPRACFVIPRNGPKSRFQFGQHIGNVICRHRGAIIEP